MSELEQFFHKHCDEVFVIFYVAPPAIFEEAKAAMTCAVKTCYVLMTTTVETNTFLRRCIWSSAEKAERGRCYHDVQIGWRR